MTTPAPSYEEAANTVVNQNGATLEDLSANQLAQIVHSDSDLADAARVVLIHDYCEFKSDYDHFGIKP